MTYIRILIAVSGLALLTACGGGGVTISATDIAKLEAELRKAKNAQRDAENARDAAESARKTTETAIDVAKSAQADAERLRGQAEISMSNAVSAQLNAGKEIARLKEELATAIEERDSARGDKDAANLRITELEGDLESLTRVKKSADADVLRLTGELATATRALSTADAEVLRLTGELETVTGDKDTAESQRDDARDERDKARTAEATAKRLQGNAEKAKTKAEGLQRDAETARDNALLAQRDAETAKATAEGLQGDAEDARDDALDAQRDAEKAKAKAEGLQGDAETARDNALDAQTDAETARDNALDAQRDAETARDNALDAQRDAETARDNALDAQTDAETARDNALDAQRDAENARDNALDAQRDAETARDNALDAQRDAETARDNALDAQRDAETARDNALLAKGNAENAKTKAEGLQRDAEEARDNALEAQKDAEDAKAKAEGLQGDAEDERDDALLAQRDAETVRDNALDAQRDAETARDNALDAQTDAETARDNALDAQRDAETVRDNALDAQRDAETARDNALDAQTDAETARDNALEAQKDAETERDNALLAKGNAEKAKTKAEGLQRDAETARDNALLAKGNAETARDNALDAQRNAEDAKAKAERLQRDAEDARDDALDAQGDAEDARNDALNAQTDAETARDNALLAQRDAETERDNALLAQTDAETERDNALLAQRNAETERDNALKDLEAANTEITRLTQFIRPTYANWKLAVNPETVPNTATPQNQFLQADADSISTEGTTAVPNDVQTLNLLTATFDGLPLDGQAADGVAFFQGKINRASYNYAGIFSGTDLGAPITNTAGTVAIWYGSFNHTLNPSKDFALTVTFNKIGGTLDAVILAGIANDRFIFDDVRFDTRGLITGEVLYTKFSPNDPTATPSTKTATLRGLIGEQGAVGVFVGEVGSNIAGGFVAHPTAKLDPNKINFADWGGVDGDPKKTVINKDNTGRDPLLYGVAGVVDGVASVGNSNPKANFIQGLAISPVDNEGFHFVGTPYASATVTGDVLYLGEDRTSGLAFSYVSGTGVTDPKYYAGLLPATDLGVPITAKDFSVTWDAQLKLTVNSQPYLNPSFKMRVRFNGNEGTISSGTPAGRGFTNGGVNFFKSGNLDDSYGHLLIKGKFGRDGVLYDALFATGKLTGLIGVNGAVGAFVGDTFTGGFVAYPNAANTINVADWGRTAAGDPKTTVINKDNTGTEPLLNGFESIVNIGPEVNFIQGLPTLRGKGFNFAGTSFSDADVHGDVLLLDEGSSSGVAFSQVLGTGVRNRKYYAGLLPGTNLGSPIRNSNASAIWNAQLRAVSGGLFSDTLEYSHPGFKMQVTYNGIGHSTINSGTVSNGEFTKGSVTVPYTNLTALGFDGSSDFNIQGKFGDDGLLYGTVNRGENIEATLTGLVGVNGAVGAFVGGGIGANIAGGFVAHPIANVNFVNWAGFAGNRRTTVINADNTGTLPLLNGAASVVNSGDRVNFIERLAISTSDGQGFDFAGTAFRKAKASVRGDVLYLDKDKTSGSGVAFSQVSGTEDTGERYYAGLLLGTNLGSRITAPNISVIWDAELMGVFKISTSNPQRYSSRHFKMQVIFDGNKGTISSGIYSGSSFTPGRIPTERFGDFNIEGKFGRDGLLYGKVGTNLEGTLTGLIGVDGAVGAFAFTSNILSYVGGFVAHPIGKVNFASWGGAVGNPKAIITAGINEIITSEAGTAPLLNGAASVGNANPTGNFIQGLPTLDGQGFDFAGTGFADAIVTGGVLYLDEDSNSGSGVAFSHVRGTGGVNRDKYYAGLLSDTALGLPIADPNTSAIWDARLMGVFKIFRQQQYSNLDFKMQVIFDGNEGTISSGTVSDGSFTPGKISTIGGFGDFNIEGRFDHDGLLYGTVGTTELKGTLTGLIGVDGAVGAFAFASNAVSYVGGFVATPPE